MTTSNSVLIGLALGILVLVFVVQISTGAPFDFISHQIDKIFTLEDKEGTINNQGVASLVNLAGVARNVGSDLNQVMQLNTGNCIHRTDNFDKSLFEEYNILLTSQGQATRISIVPKDSSQELSYYEIGSGVKLCSLNDVEQLNTIKDIINSPGNVLRDFNGLIPPNRVQTIQFSLIDFSRFFQSASKHTTIGMVVDSNEPIRFRNIDENEHMYFLKLDDTLCVLPVDSPTRSGECSINDGLLRSNCVEGPTTNSMNLKRIYEGYSEIACTFVDAQAQDQYFIVRQLTDFDGQNSAGQGFLTYPSDNIQGAMLLEQTDHLGTPNGKYWVTINPDIAIGDPINKFNINDKLKIKLDDNAISSIRYFQDGSQLACDRVVSREPLKNQDGEDIGCINYFNIEQVIYEVIS